MPHLRLIIPLAVAAALLVVAPTAAAAKAPAKCARAGSKTIAHNSVARVYEVQDGESIPTRTLYGCLYDRGKSIKLADAYDDEFVLGYGYTTVRLAGRFVAFGYYSYDISCKADCPPGYDPGDDFVTVWDLTARKGRSEDAVVAGQTLKLNSRGASAWLQRLGNGQREVHAWDSAGHRVLDTGPIKSAPFALNGSNLTWVNGDVQHTVPLS